MTTYLSIFRASVRRKTRGELTDFHFIFLMQNNETLAQNAETIAEKLQETPPKESQNKSQQQPQQQSTPPKENQTNEELNNAAQIPLPNSDNEDVVEISPPASQNSPQNAPPASQNSPENSTPISPIASENSPQNSRQLLHQLAKTFLKIPRQLLQ